MLNQSKEINPGDDDVAQLVEHRLENQRPEVRTPSGAQEKIMRGFFSESKCCSDSLSHVSVPNPCVYIYARIRMITYAR